MNICPCKRCISRTVGCHIECPAYNNWKKKNDEINANRADARRKNNILIRYTRRHS